VQSDAAAWLTKSRADWKEVTKFEGEPWKQLQPLYVAAPVPLDQVDPEDKLWQADLELGRADLDQIEAVFVSMRRAQWAMCWPGSAATWPA